MRTRSAAGNVPKTGTVQPMGYANYSNYGGLKATEACPLVSFIAIT
jgi:hypothetical protein